MIPEPTNKLDAAAALVGVVSGSEGETFDWGQIDWRQVEDHERVPIDALEFGVRVLDRFLATC